MEAEAGRRRARVRVRTGAAFAALAIVLAIVSQLWIRSRRSESAAIEQARLAEAQQLLALGQVEEDANPTLAFAYALAALERADTAEIRRFALRLLWKGPMYFVHSEGSNDGPSSLSFNADGEWLLDSGYRTVRLWHRGASEPIDAPHSFTGWVTAHFTGDRRKLVIVGRRNAGGTGADVVWLPELTELARLELPGEMPLAVRGDQLISMKPRAPAAAGADIVTHSLTGGARRTLGSVPGRLQQLAIDRSGERYLLAHPGDRMVVASAVNADADRPLRALRIPAPVSRFWLDEDGERIAILDDAGVLRLASLAASDAEPHPITGSWPTRDPRTTGLGFDPRITGLGFDPRLGFDRRITSLGFDRVGRWLVAAFVQGFRMWDLTSAPSAEPLTLLRGRITTTLSAVFDPSGRWLATEDLGGLAFWPAVQHWAAVLRVSEDQPRDVAFDPAGEWIAAAARWGGVEIWPLADGHGPPHQRFTLSTRVTSLAVSPNGKLIAAGTDGKAILLSVPDLHSRHVYGFDSYVWAMAFDVTGNRFAAAGRVDGGSHEIVRLVDLQTGRKQDLDPGDGMDITNIAFLPDGRVLTSNFGALRRLDPRTGSSERLAAPPGIAFLGPDRRHVLILHTTNPNFPIGPASVFDLKDGRGWPLSTHGDQVTLMAWAPSGQQIVTGSRDGLVRVGPMTGEEPHLLIGHQGPVWGVRFDPTGRLVASTSEDGTVRIWPIPTGQPIHTLARDALLEKLRSLTNVRIVRDATTPTRYRVSVVRFQGWRDAPPTW
jgi:WD40 repeat protein